MVLEKSNFHLMPVLLSAQVCILFCQDKSRLFIFTGFTHTDRTGSEIQQLTAKSVQII